MALPQKKTQSRDLFHSDSAQFFAGAENPRLYAQKVILQSRLFREAAAGRLWAVKVLYLMLWGLIRSMDAQVEWRSLPTNPIVGKLSVAERTVNEVFREMRKAIDAANDMMDRSRSQQWEADISMLSSKAVSFEKNSIQPGFVQKIIKSSSEMIQEQKSISAMFASKAALECLIEEIAKYLSKHSTFTQLFGAHGERWGDAYLPIESTSSSRLNIYADLARVYYPNTAGKKEIMLAMREVMDTFIDGLTGIEEHLALPEEGSK